MNNQERWALMLGHLRAYRSTLGHADVPRSYTAPDGLRLGAWLHRQRSLQHDNRLPLDRQAALEALGVRWAIHDRARALAALQEYFVLNGHTLIPADFVTDDGYPLGTWAQSRRREHARDADRTDRLWPELAGGWFAWEVRDADRAWLQGLEAMRSYRRQFGHAHVPWWFVTDDGFPLGRWVDTRRTDYRRGILSGDRVAALDELGMLWQLREVKDTASRDARELAHFMQMLTVLRGWQEEHPGQVPQARTRTEDGAAIGRWLQRQRLLLRDGRLDEVRAEALGDALDPPRRLSA